MLECSHNSPRTLAFLLGCCYRRQKGLLKSIIHFDLVVQRCLVLSIGLRTMVDVFDFCVLC